MTFDFDKAHTRSGTDSQKWQKYAGKDILPMWVADMDFTSPGPILEALRTRLNHGIFGYARPLQSETDTVVNAMKTRYGWSIDPSWIVWMPGLVCTLNVIARAFAERGDQIMCNTPVYTPFMSAATNAGRESLDVPLAYNSSKREWEIDFDAMERAVTPRLKVLILCNPHNPVARVYRREELQRLADFCVRHKIVLCSDEIHCDLILDPVKHPHVPIATLSPEIAAQTITLMAPSKTYNIPGLATSFAIISDPRMRAIFNRACQGIVAEVNVLGYSACAAAYSGSCEPWRETLLAYLRGNRDLIADTLLKSISSITMDAPHEATYLAWLNIGKLGLKNPAAHFEKHGIGMSDGAIYGAKPGTYMRLNFGCPRATLVEGLKRIKAAAESAEH